MPPVPPEYRERILALRNRIDALRSEITAEMGELQALKSRVEAQRRLTIKQAARPRMVDRAL